MNQDESRDVLHCLPCGPRRGGGRGPEGMRIALRPVSGAVTLFSLAHACLAAGLLEQPPGEEKPLWFKLNDQAQRQWRGSVERFFEAAATIGLSRERILGYSSGCIGAVIGWHQMPHQVGSAYALRVCPDVEITVAILSRCIGDMFIGSREPDLAWDRLFERNFAADADLAPATDLTCSPWCHFTW